MTYGALDWSFMSYTSGSHCFQGAHRKYWWERLLMYIFLDLVFEWGVKAAGRTEWAGGEVDKEPSAADSPSSANCRIVDGSALHNRASNWQRVEFIDSDRQKQSVWEERWVRIWFWVIAMMDITIMLFCCENINLFIYNIGHSTFKFNTRSNDRQLKI